MSIRDLVEPECAGPNPLMRLGNHLTRDSAYKDEGLNVRTASPGHIGRPELEDNKYVNEFLGQLTGPPQTFRMHDLIKEMHDIDHTYNQQVVRAPPVIDQVRAHGVDWAKEFSSNHSYFNVNEPGKSESEVWGTFPLKRENSSNQWTGDFLKQMETVNNILDEPPSIPETAGDMLNRGGDEHINYTEFMRFVQSVNDGDVRIDNSNVTTASWMDDFTKSSEQQNRFTELPDADEDWVASFNQVKDIDTQNTESYNNQFWNRLHEEWKKISEQDETGAHPWLNEFAEYYDPYKEYKFDEENALIDVDNAFERGKEFMEQGDIPSAVLCFETAAKQNPDNADIWELLGLAQASNEKDPNAIAAMKKCLELNPGNLKILMAIAVSYTNESIQNLALRSLISWMSLHPTYSHLVPVGMLSPENDGAMATSLIRGLELKEVENLFLTAVQSNQKDIDPEIQEALGILFSLSSDYDKAADCFQTALQVRPDNAKTWNRLGASLANGNRSVEAVEAYKKALEIQPGYIRARYNVGIICINLKSYKEAAEHFLTALNYQSSSASRSGLKVNLPSNKMSETIWSTLRMTISLMGRHDLQASVTNRNLEKLNNEFESE